MKDAAPVAYAAIVLLGGALAAVVYLGNRAGPSSPPGHATAAPPTTAPPTLATASSTTATTATATTATTTPASSTTAPPAGAGRFVPSADLSPAEQLALERLNRVRTNPPAFLPAWRRMLADERAAGLPCDEPPTMLDPIAGYAPRQPLAANQQLTDAARKHAEDQFTRDYFEHVDPDGLASNERVIAAGYPLPVDVRLTDDGAYYSSKHGDGNLESLHMTAATGPTPHRYPPDAYATAVDSLIIDSCVASRGHRLHLLGVRATGQVELEIGLGAFTGDKPDPAGTRSELQIVVEIATRNDGNRFVLGVVYRDANANHAYDAGEGQADTPVAIPAAGVHTRTGPGGGYALPVPAAFTGAVLVGARRLPVTVTGANVKLDVTVD